MTGGFSWYKAGRVRREHSEDVTRTGEREIARHAESRGQLCLEMIRHVQSVSYLSLQPAGWYMWSKEQVVFALMSCWVLLGL